MTLLVLNRQSAAWHLAAKHARDCMWSLLYKFANSPAKIFYNEREEVKRIMGGKMQQQRQNII